nr:transmembrane 9 superfamily member 2/4 [Ipomoea batatas]
MICYACEEPIGDPGRSSRRNGMEAGPWRCLQGSNKLGFAMRIYWNCTRVQFLCMTLVTMIFAALGFLSPSNCGGLMTAMLLLWAFMGVFAGYASARLYKMFKGSDWKKITLWTAFMFPGTVFAIFFVLNAIIWGEKSSGRGCSIRNHVCIGFIVVWNLNLSELRLSMAVGVVSYLSEFEIEHGIHARSRICNRTQDSQIKLIDELWELHLPGIAGDDSRLCESSGELVTSGIHVSISTYGIIVDTAITQVAVTAVAIASGTCLSTKVDCLWPKVDEQPGSLVLDGVDVTGCPAQYLMIHRMHSTALMRTCFCKSPYKTLLVKGTRSPRKMTFL